MTGRRNGMLILALVALATACDSADNAVDEPASDTTSSAAGASASAAGEESADIRFLRGMIDHHEGLVLVAQRAQERAQDDSVSATADHLHRTQVEERDSMLALLANGFGVQHTPRALARHVAQADSVTGLPIADHDRYFLRAVIAHHREGIAMVDLIASGLRNENVRSMAETLKAEQQREIAELESKLASL